MLNAHTATTLFMEDYTDRLRYGEEDADEALHNAVDFALRRFSDATRSDAHYAIAEAWGWGPFEARFIQAEHVFREVLGE